MMSQARFNERYSGMTSIARKVYDAVPMTQAWTAAQVVAELHRVGVSQDFRLIGGCLNSLMLGGLIFESERGQFTREPIRPLAIKSPTPIAPPNQDTMKPIIAKAVAPVTISLPVLSPADMLGKIAEKVMRLAVALREIGAEMADAAIDIEAQFEHNEADLAKLKQLQALLKSLG